MSQLPLGFLFDLDGTLADSESSIAKSWEIFALEHGVDAPVLNDIHGIPARTTISKYLPQLNESELDGAVNRMEELEIETATLVRPIRGVKELLAHLDEKQIPWTIVTSGTWSLASARTKAIGFELPANSITFEKVQFGKPHPQPFLLGAEQIGIAPELCWAVEDSISGLKSANSAGCTTIGILTHYSQADLPPAAHYVSDLLEVIALLQKSASKKRTS